MLRILLITIFSLALPAQAQQCSRNFFEIPLASQLASAGFFANFWKQKGSVSYELEKAFHQAKDKVLKLKQPELECAEDCALRNIPYMYFYSVPHKVLAHYEDYNHCQSLYLRTSADPIRYARSDFEDIDDLMDWIEDFAQGSGPEGSDLYEKCDRSCSPRYFYKITKKHRSDKYYQVSVEVVCGHARDKDDDQYKLEYSFRWICE